MKFGKSNTFAVLFFIQRKEAKAYMYNTDEELDRELDELRRQIEEEALQNDSPEEEKPEEAPASELTDSEKLLTAVKALFSDDMTTDELIGAVSDAVNTACKRFRADVDADELIRQEGEIKQIYSDFDIASELKNNTVFKRLIANGINVHSALLASNSAYADCIAEAIKRDAKREMAELLRRGKEQIMPETQKKSSLPEYDITSMSDEEFEEIERKVKQNKRVFL